MQAPSSSLGVFQGRRHEWIWLRILKSPELTFFEAVAAMTISAWLYMSSIFGASRLQSSGSLERCTGNLPIDTRYRGLS